jgi:DNA-binding winged helix-turn-helix (wHTH) protein/TolB-like protein/Tfp pilus assembly protein PilF
LIVGLAVELIDNAELEDGFRIGDVEVYPRQQRVRSKAGNEKRVEPGVMAVLVAIAQRNGNLITRDELVAEVWKRPTADGPIDRRIMLIRKALGDREKPHRCVETLHKRGYRLLLPVEPLARGEPSDASVRPATTDDNPSQSIVSWRSLPVRWLFVLAAFVAAVFAFWPDGVDGEFESIAVLPFDNLSADPRDEYLVKGFKEELVQTLHNIRDLTVINVRTRAHGRDGVDTLLYGSLQRSGDLLKASFVIETAAGGITVAAGDVEGPLDDLFELQEALAQKVQQELYPGDSQRLVSRSRPANAAAYNEYLLGSYAFDRRGQADNLERAIERFRRTIDLDPEFGPAYLQLATAYALLPDHRGAGLEASNKLALDTVSDGIEADPNIEAAAGAVYGFVFHKEKRWEQSRAAYERAVNAPFVDVNAFNWYSRMLASVGDLQGSLRVARRGVELAPDSAVLNSRVAMAYSWLGMNEDAHRYFERANALGAGGTTHMLASALSLYRLGETDQSYAVAQEAVSLAGVSGNWVDPVFLALNDSSGVPAALAAVDAATGSGELNPQAEVVVRALLGDVDGALEVAERLEAPGEVFEMDLLFTPELKTVRQRQEFVDLMRRLGVDAYWRANSCTFHDADVVCPTG